MAHRFLFLCSRKLNFAQIYRSILIFFCGIFLGAAANLFDLYTTNLGNVFSQTSIWIFLCTAVSVYSSSPKRAAVNVFFFCTAMLFSYYGSAVISHRSFSPSIVCGWLLFAAFTPLLGSCVWHAGKSDLLSKLMTFILLFIEPAISIILFDKVRFSDLLIGVFTVLLLIKKQASAVQKSVG